MKLNKVELFSLLNKICIFRFVGFFLKKNKMFRKQPKIVFYVIARNKEKHVPPEDQAFFWRKKSESNKDEWLEPWFSWLQKNKTRIRLIQADEISGGYGS